ncbi:MAG: hypothetical protein AB8G22_00220 [Saprospiraceae bacterium]
MTILKWLFIPTLFLLFSTSCTPTLSPFTERLYEENRWSADELKRIQFYLSEDLVLRRQVNEGSSEIIRGEIKMVNGKRVEEIIIRRNTPGVFLYSPKNDRFAVTFESNDDDYLMFGPNPKASGRFVVLASDWNKRQGTISYAGRKWKVDYRDAMASLLVDLKKTRKISVKSRTAQGRKVG